MSRVGLAPIEIPAGVTIDISKSNVVSVKGPKGELSENIDSSISVSMEDGVLSLSRSSNAPKHRSLHGLSRALINNMVVGVTEGYTKTLELVGVGYRVTNTGNLLELILGYSHPIYFYVPDEVKVESKTEKGKNPMVELSSIDKQLIGQVCAKIRAFRKPEPYKGKGVRFLGEQIRRKAGKTASK